MYKKKKIVAIITARKGSKGLKNKNVKKLNRFPLIAYSINYANQSKLIDRVYVTTDGKEIEKISKKFKAIVIKRPKKLASDKIMNDLAVVHAVKFIEKNLNFNFSYIVFLQPTTPLRRSGELDKAIKYAINNNFDTVFSAVSYNPFLWRKKKKLTPINYDPFKRKIRQKLNDINETGSFYITKKKTFIDYRNRFGKKIDYFISDFNSFYEIDSLKDFKYISEIIKSSIPRKYKLCLPKKNEDH